MILTYMAEHNFLKQILQGGACNTDSTQSSVQSSNPIKNLLNNVVLGKASVRQRRDVFYPEEEQMTQSVVPTMQSTRIPQQVQHQNQVDKDQIVKERLERNRNKARERRAWHRAQEEYNDGLKRSEVKEKKHMEKMQIGIMNEWEQREMETRVFVHWNESMQMHAMNQKRSQMYAMQSMSMQSKGDNEKVRNVNSGQEGRTVNLVKGSLDEIVNLMKTDSDPRFQKSKYLEFLENSKVNAKQASQGEIKGDQSLQQVVINAENYEEKKDDLLTEEQMEAIWAQEENKFEENEAKNSRTSEEGATDKVFEEVWQNLEAEVDEETKVDITAEKILDKDLEDAWKAEEEEEKISEEDDLFDLGLESEYKFSENNPFMERTNCLDLAIEFLNLGQTANTVLALESALNKNMDNKDLWKLLGKIYQDNDQEKQALDCLIKAIQLDSKDTDTLLALEVGLTNRSEEIRAMKCMKRWLTKNPKYEKLTSKDRILKGIRFDKDGGESLNLADIKLVNAKLKEICERIVGAFPNDSELHTSLALLNFISRDYTTSLYHFNEALKFDPKNYSLWNKLGATLAHLGKSNEAINAYYRALEFKPNYVRAWVNLGISQAYKGEYEEAARLYLSALSLNPEAQHIWNHLKSTLVVLKRYDLSRRVTEKNLEIFKDEFDIISLEDLPSPEIDYKELNSLFLIKKDAEKWIAEF